MARQPESYCGLYCGACAAPACNGCKVLDEHHWSPNCEFIRCATQKGIESCGLCPDVPCEALMEFSKDEWPHHKTVVPNAMRIKEIGLQAWLEEQQARWSCKQCGAPFAWYDKACTKCGAEVLNAPREFGES